LQYPKKYIGKSDLNLSNHSSALLILPSPDPPN